MERCATCTHWNTDGEELPDDVAEREGWGVCAMGESWRDHAEHEGTTAYAVDWENYRAALVTAADHGCTMHEAKGG